MKTKIKQRNEQFPFLCSCSHSFNGEIYTCGLISPSNFLPYKTFTCQNKYERSAEAKKEIPSNHRNGKCSRQSCTIFNWITSGTFTTIVTIFGNANRKTVAIQLPPLDVWIVSGECYNAQCDMCLCVWEIEREREKERVNANLRQHKRQTKSFCSINLQVGEVFNKHTINSILNRCALLMSQSHSASSISSSLRIFFLSSFLLRSYSLRCKFFLL